MPIKDRRIEYQKEAIISAIVAWGKDRKISGYLNYVQLLRRWVDAISTGAPIAPNVQVTAGEKAELRTLVSFLTSMYIDIETQRKAAGDLKDGINLQRLHLENNIDRWKSALDELSRGVRQVEEQHKVRFGKAETNTFSANRGELVNTTIDLQNHTLRIIPDAEHINTIDTEKIITKVLPAHNSDGGIIHNDLTPHSNSVIKYNVYTDTIPRISIDGHNHYGIIGSVELVFPNGIYFNTIEMDAGGTHPLDILKIEVSSHNDRGVSPWKNILLRDDKSGYRADIIYGVSGQILIRGFPTTLARYVKISVKQSHDEAGVPSTNDSYSSDLSVAAEGAAPGFAENLPSRRYLIDIKDIEFKERRFHGAKKGSFLSNKIYSLDREPIGAVGIKTTEHTSSASTVEWNIVDVNRGIKVPVLPKGTKMVHEVATFVNPNSLIWKAINSKEGESSAPFQSSALRLGDIILSFPIAIGESPIIYVNGGVIDPKKYHGTGIGAGGETIDLPVTIEEIMSTRIRTSNLTPKYGDVFTIEYPPAIGQCVVVYVIRKTINTFWNIVTSSSGDRRIEEIVFASRDAAESFRLGYIATNFQAELVSVKPALARIDEFDRWFMGGTREVYIPQAQAGGIEPEPVPILKDESVPPKATPQRLDV
jgi:hypothetical protein